MWREKFYENKEDRKGTREKKKKMLAGIATIQGCLLRKELRTLAELCSEHAAYFGKQHSQIR